MYLYQMVSEAASGAETVTCIRTLRLKVKSEAYSWLNAAAIETNQVWNFANASSDKAARPFSGPGRWLSAFDLDKLTAGATECFERIGSDSIQRVNAEFATRRKQAKKTKIHWRKSFGSNRSLGVLLGFKRPGWRATVEKCDRIDRQVRTEKVNESEPSEDPSKIHMTLSKPR